MAASKNEQAIRAFAAHFDPPLQVAQTEKLAGNPIADGWQTAVHIPELEFGLTAVCWGKGYFKAWAEGTGTRDGADAMGWIFANLLSLAHEAEQAAHFHGSTDGGGVRLEMDSVDYQSGEKHSEAEPAPLTDAERAAFEPAPANVAANVLANSPNPAFVDMNGLLPAERIALAQHFPELRYAVQKDGTRVRIDPTTNEMKPDPTAGYARADQLEHVRRVMGGPPNAGRSVPRFARSGLAGQQAAARLAALGDGQLCDHTNADGSSAFKKNSIGGLTTCQKCGVQGPKPAPVTTDADAELAAFLAQRGEGEA